MRQIGQFTITFGGLLILVVASQSVGSIAPRPVDEQSLDAIRGGADQFCVTIAADAAAVDCTECTTNGNGGSFKCNYGPPAQTFGSYVTGQSPPLHVFCNVQNCPNAPFPSAYNYPNSVDCTGWPQFANCLRTVTFCNSVADFGVTCPPP